MNRKAQIRLLAFGLLWISAAGALGAENQLTDAEKRGGWKLLFDGKSTDAWRNYKQKSLNAGWKVEDGALTRAAGGAGDIVTVDEYDNFELSIEYKIGEAGNSGIMFHVTELDDTPWMTGPEVQVQDNVKGHDPQKSGWLYQLFEAKDPETGKTLDATRNDGWNQIQLLVTRDHCEVNMNGWRYYTFKKGSPDWDARVAKSKFAAFAGFGKATTGHICLQDHGDRVAYRNIKIRSLKPNGVAPEPVDGALNVKVEPAFADLRWSGWEPVDADGVPAPLRPILLTHAGDATNRIFVPTQQGILHVFPNSPKAAESKVFLDISDRVRYIDKENEEGLLGLAFHPEYRTNGQFFVYYVNKREPHLSVVSRFHVSKDDPNRADPKSEEELLSIPEPFWNHKGGTLAFGPDGHLYIALGDGGAGNDPFFNGQNLETHLGKILRIDVDHKENGKNYAIPKDNPFVGTAKAKPEIFAYGFRNIWRMAFDRQTGTLWAADVGQNLWEEIDLVTKGGNFGWSLREGSHPFGNHASSDSSKLVEPIWEYDHQVGKSITGGVVYRGKQIPDLVGKYLYADYVTGKIWALDYDEKAQKVRGNYSIASPMMPIISFGEDQDQEVYFSIVAANGKGLFKFAPSK